MLYADPKTVKRLAQAPSFNSTSLTRNRDRTTIDKAIAMLEKPGVWVQATSSNPVTMPHPAFKLSTVCAVAAIYECEVSRESGERVMRLFSRYCGAEGERTAVYRWNDAKERTLADVLDALRTIREWVGQE
jgi:hypothetical protein